MDVNLLPDQLKRREEAELKAKAGRPLEVPMSTPLKDAPPRPGSVAVPVAPGSHANADPALPHVREQAYISVSKEGKIVHQAASESTSAPGRSWWRRLVGGPAVRRVGGAPVSAAPPTPPVPVPPPTPPPTPTPPTSPPVPAHSPQSRFTSPVDVALGPPPLGINLIPTEWSWVPRLVPEMRRRIILALTLLLVLTVGGSVAGRIAYERHLARQIATLRQQEADVRARIATYASQEATWRSLKDRLAVLSALLDRHVALTPAFHELERTVRPGVQYHRVSLESDGTASVSGTAFTYDDVAAQVVALEGDRTTVRDVTVGTVAYDPTRRQVTFTLAVTFQPTLLRYGSRP